MIDWIDYFPLMYAISNKKEKKRVVCNVLDGETPLWSITARRNLLEAEMEDFEALVAEYETFRHQRTSG